MNRRAPEGQEAHGGRQRVWRLLATALVLLLCQAAFPADQAEKRTILYEGRTWSYWLYVPRTKPAGAPMPLLVVVHGAGGTGLDQIEAWKSVAKANHIILLAPVVPNSAADWDRLYDHPEWIHAAIEEVARDHPVDPRRTYLWGYSAGGMFTFYFAFLESRYFAAAGVHGGVIEGFKYQMADFAARKLPIAYYMGEHDQWWSLQQTRATRDALLARGFPLHYAELKGADHNFYARAPEITEDAWKFFRKNVLPTEPQFEPLDLKKIKAALR